jgi:Tat protein secretion system quality control protein TatD with DNase activity
VPDDRLLLESDVDDADKVDSLMQSLIGLVCQAKGEELTAVYALRVRVFVGWTTEQTIQITNANAARFFEHCLPSTTSESTATSSQNN